MLWNKKYGLNMPKKMREDFGYCVKGVSDHKHKRTYARRNLSDFPRQLCKMLKNRIKLIDFVLNKQQMAHLKVMYI